MAFANDPLQDVRGIPFTLQQWILQISKFIGNGITVEGGGTGLTSVEQGDMLYGSATNVYSLLNKTATDSYLGNSGTDNNPAWQAKAALTRVDDTNVTLTLGGTPATALLKAVSLTLGWSGQLAMTRGGSGASLTASNGGIVYTDANSMEVLSGTATAGQILRSGASSAPSWSTATYPATVTSTRVLYGTATNAVGESANLVFNGTTLTTTALVVSSTANQNSIGGAVLSGAGCFFGAATTNQQYGIYTDLVNTPTSGVTLSSLVRLNGTLTIHASGAHTTFANLHVTAPTIVAGGGTLTNAATVYIPAAPTGATNNFALWVDAGRSRFDGEMQFGTHTGIGVETLTGYITIIDAGGTTRKIGVIS